MSETKGRGFNAYGVPVAEIERLLDREDWKSYTCGTCGRLGQFIGTFKCCGETVRPSPDHLAASGKMI